MDNVLKDDYKDWIIELKKKVRISQLKAAVIINSALIEFYWDLGKIISNKIKDATWGDKILYQISKDLRDEFPQMKGFSVSNLKVCKLFYNYFQISSQPVNQLENETTLTSSQPANQIDEKFVMQEVTKIPWGHIKIIITKVKDKKIAAFYILKTRENNWSRDVLALQIKSNLFERIGGSISNFKNTLPDPYSDLAQQTIKDPYVFDFLTLSEGFKERDIEQQLVYNIRKFLLELGKGFAFVGQQYNIQIAENDYFLDLLFYHIKLKCYVVIELKNTSFIPEYAGKLNFYLSAVDSLLKEDDDKPTIGILLCRDKNNLEAEFALRDINKPIGISEFELTEILPENLKSSLPSIEELEKNIFIDE
jgi:predicted nuclease of restriction endonuclease-like (RecB) superfamily